MQATETQRRDRGQAHVPMRTCVGCRQVAPQAALRRAVADEAGRLVPDPERRLPGRGAWVHPVEKCLIAALSRGGFERSLRRKVRAPAAAALLPLLSDKDQEQE